MRKLALIKKIKSTHFVRPRFLQMLFACLQVSLYLILCYLFFYRFLEVYWLGFGFVL